MDLSKVSTEDLTAYQSGDLKKVSTAGLQLIQSATTDSNARGQKIDKYLSETDNLLGMPEGTSARQINQESKFSDSAFNKVSKAAGMVRDT